MPHGEPQRTLLLPKVTPDLQGMPKKYIDGRSAASGRNKPASAWPDFLASLNVGDRFKIDCSRLQGLKTHAKALKIDLVWRWRQEELLYDVWIYGVPGNRTKIYKSGSLATDSTTA